MKHTTARRTAAAFFVVATTVFLFTACRQTPKAAAVPSLTIGIQNSPSNALIILADDKHLFDTTKVRVFIKEFSAGKLALQALLGNAGDLQVAVSAETPVVLSTLGGNQPRVIGQIVNARNECRIVVRRDNTLDSPEKYFSKKRVIATSQGGSPEWLTWNFLKKYKLGPDKVEISAMAPENMPAAVASKAVDGCSIFDPYARLTEKELGATGLTFLNENMKSYYVLSVRDKTLTENADALSALLDGLRKAEDFVKNNPAETKQIIARRTKLDAVVIEETWRNYDFTLGFDAALPELCRAQAEWAIKTGKYPESTVIPDFDKILRPELLKNAGIVPAN